MKVILKEDVADLGVAGETVEVRDGYGRNFLIPRRLAVPATKSNLKSVASIRKEQEVRSRKRLRAAETVKARLEELSLNIEVNVGEEERLFGSVTNGDIAEKLAAEGIEIDRRSVILDEPIKQLGVYTVPVKIEKEVTADLKVWVIKKA